jgi:hypothetical protein
MFPLDVSGDGNVEVFKNHLFHDQTHGFVLSAGDATDAFFDWFW